MSRVPLYVFSLAAAGAAFVVSAYGQAVISTRSGVVHFFDGSVSVAGRPLEAHFGKFSTIPEGAELKTEQGHAEVLLTPGVILRVGEKSSIRLVSSELANTRVELLSGSVMLESAEAAVGTSVTLAYRGWSLHQPNQGNYRVDTDPPRLQVRGGTVEVSSTGRTTKVSVAEGMELAFADELTPKKSATTDGADVLNDWVDGREQSISADNSISADIQDPATMSSSSVPVDAFTYFPMLGYPSLSSGVGGYNPGSYYPGAYSSGVYSGGGYAGAVAPYQPGLYGVGLYGLGLYGPIYGAMPLYQSGFYSLYMPGLTFRPGYLRFPSTGLGLGGRPIVPPLRPGGITTTSPISRPPVVRPGVPAVAPHPAIHVGGH
jgi:FecR protein